VFDYTDLHYGGGGSGTSLCGNGGEINVLKGSARVVESHGLFTDSAHAGVYSTAAGMDGGYLGISGSRFTTSMCGIALSTARAEVVGNDFANTLDLYGFMANTVDRVRVWYNTSHAPVDVLAAASTPVSVLKTGLRTQAGMWY
jgi:hypothetical protein